MSMVISASQILSQPSFGTECRLPAGIFQLGMAVITGSMNPPAAYAVYVRESRSGLYYLFSILPHHLSPYSHG
jgi:hypothetical protein